MRSNLETSEAEKRTDAKRFKPLAAPKGGCLSAGLGERSAQGFSFLDGIFVRAYAPGTRPTKEGWVLVQRRSRGRLYTHAHSHPRVRTPGSFGLVETREEGAQGRDPGLCRARPSAPAISAGRSAGTRTPSLAAPSTAKDEPAPSPSAGLRRLGAAKLGADLPKGRGPEGSGRHPHLSP